MNLTHTCSACGTTFSEYQELVIHWDGTHRVPPYRWPTEAEQEQYKLEMRRDLIDRLKEQFNIPADFEETAADIWYDGFYDS